MKPIIKYVGNGGSVPFGSLERGECFVLDKGHTPLMKVTNSDFESIYLHNGDYKYVSNDCLVKKIKVEISWEFD